MKIYTKILVILSSALIVASSLALNHVRRVGYELSIYNSAYLPLVGLILSIIISLIVVVISIGENCKYGKYLGTLNIGLCTLLVILLPFIKGYVYTSLADNASHIGYILDIVVSNHIPQNNVYPTIHLLGATLHLVTGLPLYIIAYLIPPYYYIIYVFSTFLLCRFIFSENTALIASICSLTPLCYYYSQIMPMGSGFMTFPLLLFLLIKIFRHRSTYWGILLLIYNIILPFWHPLVIFLVLIIESIFLIAVPIYQSDLQAKSLIPSINSYIAQSNKYSILIILISLIIFFYWALQNLIIHGFIDSIQSIGAPVAIAPIAEAGIAFDKLGLSSITEIISLYIRLYGHLTFFGLFSILGLLHILNQLRLSNSPKRILFDNRFFPLIFLYIIFSLFCIIAAIDFVHPLTGLGSQRFLFSVYAIIPTPAAAGLSLLLPKKWTYIERKRSDISQMLKFNSLFKPFCLILVLALCFSIAIFSFFASPAIHRPNSATTIKEISGAKWIMYNGYSDYTILWDGKSTAPPYHYSDIIFGTVPVIKYPRREPNLDEDEFAHFRYNRFSTLGTSISANKYLMLRKDVNLLIYGELYPLLARYTPFDFMLLSIDNTVNLIYYNGEMEIYLVYAT